jgi:hypothetical protein
MMVLPGNSVECSGKIAMTALPAWSAAMGLLPERDPARFIILGAILGARGKSVPARIGYASGR